MQQSSENAAVAVVRRCVDRARAYAAPECRGCAQFAPLVKYEGVVVLHPAQVAHVPLFIAAGWLRQPQSFTHEWEALIAEQRDLAIVQRRIRSVKYHNHNIACVT